MRSSTQAFAAQRFADRVARRARRLPPRTARVALAAAAFGFAFVNLWVAHRNHGYTSDDVGLQTILHSWRPWNGSSGQVGEDTFVLKMPIYALTAVGLGASRTALFVASVVFNMIGLAFLGTAIAFFARRLTGSARGATVVAWATTLWVASIGGALWEVLLEPNVRNVELGLGLYLLTRFVVLHDDWPALGVRRRVTRTAVVAGAMGLLFYDDPYMLYMTAPAIAAVFGLRWLADTTQGRRADLVPIMVVAASIVAWRVADRIGHVFGLAANPRPPLTIPLDKLGTGITTSIQNVLDLAGADIFGKRVSLASTREAAIHLTVLVIGLGIGTVLVFRRRKADPWCGVVALLPVTCLLIYALSDQPLVEGTRRYVALVIPECAVLLAVVLRSLNRRQTVAVASIMVLSFGFYARDTIDAASAAPAANPNRSELELVAAVEARGLSRGYAEYWAANIVTYLSDYSLDVLPIECAAAHTNRAVWYVDADRFDAVADRSFYVTADRPDNGACLVADAVGQFGEPADSFDVGPNHVLVYDYDIGQRISS